MPRLSRCDWTAPEPWLQRVRIYKKAGTPRTPKALRAKRRTHSRYFAEALGCARVLASLFRIRQNIMRVSLVTPAR